MRNIKIILLLTIITLVAGCARVTVIDTNIRPNVHRVDAWSPCAFCSYDTQVEEFHKRAKKLCGNKTYKNTLLKTSGTKPNQKKPFEPVYYPGAIGQMNFPSFDALVTGEVYCDNAVQSLILEAQKGNRIKVLSLIEEGADINAKDEESRTALMYASMNGYIKIVEDLLGSGADINKKDIENNTALSFAKISKHKDIIELLVEKGAN